jgi:hypothetical protein
MTTPQQIAEAFSGHRFSEAYDHLATDVRWVLIGGETLQGRDSVIEACEQTAAELAHSKNEFLRFLTIAGADAVAVDAVGRYVAADGTTSVVASCDIYEFTDGVVTAITSYTTELDSP